MSNLPLRIWLMVTIGLAFSAVIIRLAWEVASTTVVASLAILTLVILTAIGLYALILYLLIAPSLKKLKSLPVGIGVIAIFTPALIGAIVHFIRFVPSSESASPPSIIIATLLLVASISGYILILWGIWSLWKSRIT